MNSSRTPRSSLHAAKARPRNSGPLSNTMASGKPLSLAIRSSTRRTRNPPSEVSTSIAGHSRVQSSTTVNMRITLPVLTQSLTKSIDQRSFGLVATGPLTAPVQPIRRCCRILIANPSSRCSRYTRLWLAAIYWYSKSRWTPHLHLRFGGQKITEEYCQHYGPLPTGLQPGRLCQDQNSPTYPYAQHFETTGVALSTGAGVDFRLSRALSVRLADLSYVHTWVPSLNGTDFSRELRFSMGVGLKVGTW